MRVLTFGEIMLRLKTPGVERMFQTPAFEATFGGGEANVAVSCANYRILNRVSLSDVTKLMKGDGSGRVQR